MLRDPVLAGRIAEQYICDLGIDRLPIDPTLIAEDDLGILVEAKPASSKGVSGMLLRLGDEFAIGYASHIKSKGFQNFSIAHEIGHYKLPGHMDQLFASGQTVHHSRAGFSFGDPYEIEADHFAASLLMPDPLFSRELDKMGAGLDAVEALSELCQTSLVATAIRYSQKSDLPVAIVLSDGELIDYCFMSDEFKRIDGLEWISKRTVLPADTVTESFNSNPANVSNRARFAGSSNLKDWFGGHRDIELDEQVRGLGNYGKTLTILCTTDEFNWDEIEEGEKLDDMYDVRFRGR